MCRTLFQFATMNIQIRLREREGFVWIRSS
nr:MAG TPA: hypothetical protein [Caudoviricetes sp.]